MHWDPERGRVRESPGTGFKRSSLGITSILMKLADWMHANRITPKGLRYILGMRSRSTVMRWLSGERQPTPPMMKQIEALTGGAVTLKDFYDPRPPKCLRKIIDSKGRVRIVYPWSIVEYHKPRLAENQNDRPRARCPSGPCNVPADSTDDPWPSPPLRLALDTLGKRAALTDRGGFTLDGRRIDARWLVIEANRVRARFDLPLIPYPGVRRLK